MITEDTHTGVKSFVYILTSKNYQDVKFQFNNNKKYNLNIDPYEKFNKTFLSVIMFKFLSNNSIIAASRKRMEFEPLNKLKEQQSCQGIISSLHINK